MARKRGSFVRVSLSCDRTGVCCARRGNEEVCGQDYKFPFDDFGLSKSQRSQLDRGYRVGKNVGRFTWFDMVDAWGGGGLFGSRPPRKRKPKRR